MKFIHAADIHLDSPLRGLEAYQDAPAERLRTATREAFDNLVSRAIEEAVDFLVIAGDVYDGDWRDFNTGLFFIRQMGRLREKQIPVYLLHGNHDAESEMSKVLLLPDNVHRFSAKKAETFRIEALRVALHGRSFKTAATTENLLPDYPEAVPGWFNIGVLHTALEGSAEHARYAPCALAELQARAYQYWALGHVHEYGLQRGKCTIAYPGNLQGRHIRECGPRGALLVTVEADEIIDIERLELDVLRWQMLEVDISAAETLGDAATLAGQGIGRLLATTAMQRPLAVRVVFTGQSAAHRELLGREAQLRQEVIAQAVALDAERIWIEKVRIASQAPRDAAHPMRDAETADALLGLEALAKTAASDTDFMNALQQEIQPLLGKLPAEVWQALPELRDLQQSPENHLPARLTQAVSVLMARLQES